MKRGYFVYPDDEFWGIGVVARTVKEAKKLAFASGELIDVDWIGIRCIWQRDADVRKLPTGVVHDMRTCLLCGLYAFIEDFICDSCGTKTLVQGYKGKALCDDCIFEEENAKEEGANEGEI